MKEINPRDDIHPSINIFVDVKGLQEDLIYDERDFGRYFSEVPTLGVYYGELLARAEHQVGRVKKARDIAKAEFFKARRQNAEASKERMSESRLETEVHLDLRYNDFCRQYDDAVYVRDLLKSVHEAIADKRSMMRAHSDLKSQELRSFGHP